MVKMPRPKKRRMHTPPRSLEQRPAPLPPPPRARGTYLNAAPGTRTREEERRRAEEREFGLGGIPEMRKGGYVHGRGMNMGGMVNRPTPYPMRPAPVPVMQRAPAATIPPKPRGFASGGMIPPVPMPRMQSQAPSEPYRGAYLEYGPDGKPRQVPDPTKPHPRQRKKRR